MYAFSLSLHPGACCSSYATNHPQIRVWSNSPVIKLQSAQYPPVLLRINCISQLQCSIVSAWLFASYCICVFSLFVFVFVFVFWAPGGRVSAWLSASFTSYLRIKTQSIWSKLPLHHHHHFNQLLFIKLLSNNHRCHHLHPLVSFLLVSFERLPDTGGKFPCICVLSVSVFVFVSYLYLYLYHIVICICICILFVFWRWKTPGYRGEPSVRLSCESPQIHSNRFSLQSGRKFAAN